MDYQEYIKTELLLLVPVMYFIGLGLKKSKLADKYIPNILGIISMILCTMWVLAACDFTGFKDIVYAIFTSITQGILIAGTSVYFNQLYKQSKKEE